MLRRAIERVQPQRLGTGRIHDVVFRARRNYHDRPVAQLPALTIQQHLPGSGFYADELVVLVVRLLADLLARAQCHQYQLHVRPGEEHSTIILVLERIALDVGDVAVHFRSPSNSGTRIVAPNSAGDARAVPTATPESRRRGRSAFWMSVAPLPSDLRPGVPRLHVDRPAWPDARLSTRWSEAAACRKRCQSTQESQWAPPDSGACIDSRT